jgi:aspartate ammonia-lyase
MMRTRIETDSLGTVHVPQDAYWGAHTARALTNFSITGQPISIYPDLISALATIKQAAASANQSLGQVPQPVAEAIMQACEEIKNGKLHDQFVVDVLQGGAGTSTNMNANEVIANRSLELLKEPRGTYGVINPHDHVNRNQSTNDTYPTAIKLALVSALRSYGVELDRLRTAFEQKAHEFAPIIKMGRTQLQEAVPMSLGSEFGAFGTSIGKDFQHIQDMIPSLCEVTLGGTAIGTGIAGHPRFAELVRSELARLTALPITTSPDLVAATSDISVFMDVGAFLKKSAVKISKICNDLRLLSSGPNLGLAEIRLPSRQSGSSIMPGKINPVIPEMVNQVAYVAIGAEATVTAAVEAGQLQLNAFEPVICHSLLQGISWMEQACSALRQHCVEGITANTVEIERGLVRSTGMATALVPRLGYAQTTELVKAASRSQLTVGELVISRGLMQEAELTDLISLSGAAG